MLESKVLEQQATRKGGGYDKTWEDLLGNCKKLL